MGAIQLQDRKPGIERYEYLCSECRHRQDVTQFVTRIVERARVETLNEIIESLLRLRAERLRG
jgi:hypothetical protein